MKKLLIFTLVSFCLKLGSSSSILVRRIKVPQAPYLELPEGDLGRKLTIEEEQKLTEAFLELSRVLKLKGAEKHLEFLLEEAKEVSKGDFNSYLKAIKLFSKLTMYFHKEEMRYSFRNVIRNTVGASRGDLKGFEENINALCNVCLFLEISEEDFSQIRELSWLAKSFAESPQDYALNLSCYLKIYQELLEIQNPANRWYIPPQRAPDPLDIIKRYSQLAWSLFKKPNYYREMLSYFTNPLEIFIWRTGLTYEEINTQIKEEFYFPISFKIVKTLEDLTGKYPSPDQLGRILRVITHLGSLLYNPSIRLNEICLTVERLIDIAKEIVQEAIGGTEVGAFSSVLGTHGIQLIIPLLKELNWDVGKMLIGISMILKEVSIKNPQVEKGRDAVQEFKDCIKAIRDLLQTIKDTGYKNINEENILAELEGIKNEVINKTPPAYIFQGIIHRRREEILTKFKLKSL